MAGFSATRRRGLLAGAATLLAEKGAKAGGDAPPWMRQQGSPVTSPPYGVPSKFEQNVIRRARVAVKFPTASSSGTPLQDLHGIITPNGLHYERHHAGVPTVDPAEHRLLIHGLVDRPLIFTIDDILRFPSVSRVHFLECSGNTPEFRDARPNLDSPGHARPAELLRMDRRNPLHPARRSRRATLGALDIGRGCRRCRDVAQRAHRQGMGRCDCGVRAEWQKAEARTGLSAAPVPARVSKAT